jgi:hypothetical protein
MLFIDLLFAEVNDFLIKSVVSDVTTRSIWVFMIGFMILLAANSLTFKLFFEGKHDFAAEEFS